jgi:hypothetical protein
MIEMPTETAAPIPIAVGMVLAAWSSWVGWADAVLVLLAATPVVVMFAVVAPVNLSRKATPILMGKGEKFPLSDSEKQRSDIAFQHIPQQKRPVPISETLEMEMAPFGTAAASCQQVSYSKKWVELTRLAILWAGIAVPGSVCTPTTGYSVTVFIALVEAVTGSSVVS